SSMTSSPDSGRGDRAISICSLSLVIEIRTPPLLGRPDSEVISVIAALALLVRVSMSSPSLGAAARRHDGRRAAGALLRSPAPGHLATGRPFRGRARGPYSGA